MARNSVVLLVPLLSALFEVGECRNKRVKLKSASSERWWDRNQTKKDKKKEEAQQEMLEKTSLEEFCTGRRKSKDAIVYLGQKTHSSYDATHKNTLNASMESLRYNMRHVGESDVIVWHEGDLTPADATALDGVTNVRFCLLTTETGWGPPPWLAAVPTMKFSAGYRYMIRFYAVTIWRTLMRLGYEWVMRMDDDSFVHSPINYNIFEDMRREGLYYGYRTLSRECPVIFGDFIDTYVSHAHWNFKKPDPTGEAGDIDYGSHGLIGLAASTSEEGGDGDESDDLPAAKKDSKSEEMDAEARHIIKFCGTWPRHCRKAEMQAALAAALKKANLFQAKDSSTSELQNTVLHKKRWTNSWYCAGPGELGYYNNWFVTNVTWWATNPSATRMIRTFDRSNLIFSRRCNDLIFQTAVIKLFMPKSLRKRYVDFTYQHHTVSSGVITFGGIETGYLDPDPAASLDNYRERFLPPSSSEFTKIRSCKVQAVDGGELHQIYYLSPAADKQKHDSDNLATATVLVNRFESPYCGPDSKTYLE